MKLFRRFDRLLMLFLLLSILFNFNCRQKDAASAHPAEPSSSSHQYRYAYAMDSCAPWDGAAVQIILTDKLHDKDSFDKPLFTISIYQSSSKLNGQTFILSQDTMIGQATICPASGDCILIKSGKVQIKEIRADRTIVGEYDLLFHNGAHEAGSFQATWLANRMLCG